MSALAYLARYVSRGQHRAGRVSVDEHLALDLELLRARLAARRRHPAGRRLAGAIS